MTTTKRANYAHPNDKPRRACATCGRLLPKRADRTQCATCLKPARCDWCDTYSIDPRAMPSIGTCKDCGSNVCRGHAATPPDAEGAMLCFVCAELRADIIVCAVCRHEVGSGINDQTDEGTGTEMGTLCHCACHGSTQSEEASE